MIPVAVSCTARGSRITAAAFGTVQVMPFVAFQLEPTLPGSWSGLPAEWQRRRGNAIRLAITPAHHEHGTWHLGAKINIAPAVARSTIVSRPGSLGRASW